MAIVVGRPILLEDECAARRCLRWQILRHYRNTSAPIIAAHDFLHIGTHGPLHIARRSLTGQAGISPPSSSYLRRAHERWLV